MKVLLLVSAFNGLTQRAWCALRADGHEVGVQLATDDQAIIDTAFSTAPDIIICPFLKDRVPQQVWQHFRTVIIHPGPIGDRGPSSLDWAITEALPQWGVTALQAIDEMDAGPIWASRTFAMPAVPTRKSEIYNGPVADAAMECIREVVSKATDPDFTPVPLAKATVTIPGARLRPTMTQADRRFDWTDPAEHIIRRIRAADGSPGVRGTLGGRELLLFDAHVGPASRGVTPGSIVAVRHGAVQVTTGDGSIWIGQVKPAAGTVDGPRIKLPAATVLARQLRGLPRSPGALTAPAGEHADIRYRRDGRVGWLSFDFYNGAMSTTGCRRLLSALRHAAAQDTTALVLVSGPSAFSNGIHLNVVEAGADPAAVAWANIKAINAVCRTIVTMTRQVVVAGMGGSAGAGGVMLALGADLIAARDGIVLNPYYDIGLYGSELHTYALPRRVGHGMAVQLLQDKLPVDTAGAAHLGLIDAVGPRDYPTYLQWLAEFAAQAATPAESARLRAAKLDRLAAIEAPLDAHLARELAEMSLDMFDNRTDFAGARHDFVHKVRPAVTPARLAMRPRSAVRIIRQRGTVPAGEAAVR